MFTSTLFASILPETLILILGMLVLVIEPFWKEEKRRNVGWLTAGGLLMAMVISLTDSVTVPTGSYTNVLVANEWSALDNPPVYEHKYYAKGVGNVLTKGVDGGWELPLIEIRYQ